jgi:hypothetical protein
LGGPAAGGRIFGDRAGPELAAVVDTGSCFPWRHSWRQSAGGGFHAGVGAVDLAANGFVGHVDHQRRAGLRALLARVFSWRFGIGWWLVVLFGLPVIALLLGLIFGCSLHTGDLGTVLIKQLGSIVLVTVAIYQSDCGRTSKSGKPSPSDSVWRP